VLPDWALSAEFVSIRQGVTFCENSVSRPLVSKLLKILGSMAKRTICDVWCGDSYMAYYRVSTDRTVSA